MTPEDALQVLKDGNMRFVEAKPFPKNLKEQVKSVSEKSNPFAVILGCFDSRVPHEIIFDCNIGDFFSIRIAGNVIDEDVLGSIEFAGKVIGTALIVVLGHSNCQAVKAAIDGKVHIANLDVLLKKIKPAVDEINTSGERNSQNNKFVEDVSKQNVLNSIQLISEKSSALKELAKNGVINIVGAMYDLETGKVEFY